MTRETFAHRRKTIVTFMFKSCDITIFSKMKIFQRIPSNDRKLWVKCKTELWKTKERKIRTKPSSAQIKLEFQQPKGQLSTEEHL